MVEVSYSLNICTWLLVLIIVIFLLVDLPPHGPDILGLQPRYQVGDEVNITCSFGPSKPAAKVNWYINGEVVRIYLSFVFSQSIVYWNIYRHSKFQVQLLRFQDEDDFSRFFFLERIVTKT